MDENYEKGDKIKSNTVGEIVAEKNDMGKSMGDKDISNKVIDKNEKKANTKKAATKKTTSKTSSTEKSAVKGNAVKKTSSKKSSAKKLSANKTVTKKVITTNSPSTDKVKADIKITKDETSVLPRIKKESKKVSKKAKEIVEKIKDNTESVANQVIRKSTKSRKSVTKKVNKDIDEYGLSNFSKYLFHEGKNYQSYDFLGAHIISKGSSKEVRFTVWAPNAEKIYVVSDLTNWSINDRFEMKKASEQGLWTLTTKELGENDLYKYGIITRDNKFLLKSDPYAFRSEVRPNTASIVANYKNYKWNDAKWVRSRKRKNIYNSPINIYEMQIGSWRRKENGDYYTYRELADILPEYILDMGYTHVELMPIMEHPLDDSWGYQVTGYYAVTSRFGTMDDLRYLIDILHQNNIGVILDWVPGHFCKDAHGLYKFDGVAEYEYKDEKKSENKGWGASNFDLGRREVKSFLISNAMYWFQCFHVDGLRVDAVANMLYLDYDRGPGEWTPNRYGNNKNLEAIEFLKQLNSAIFMNDPSVMMIAEESTSWPLVTRPVDIGGLGFNFKWNMGWMNDILEYIQISPEGRKWNHGKLTFPSMYQYSENFILPISHDEVVHGKKSLINKMWGDTWNKFAGLRLFICFMLGHPGKKTLFMGSEFGQFDEWNNNEQLQWNLIEKYDSHRETQKFFKDINKFYLDNKCLWKYDYDPKGFEWIDADNKEQSIFIFMRKADKPEDTLIMIFNFKSDVYYDFKVGVPYYGEYIEKFNSDSKIYGGSDQIISDDLIAEKSWFHNQPYSIKVKVPPMAALILGVKSIYKEEKITKKTVDSIDNQIKDKIDKEE